MPERVQIQRGGNGETLSPQLRAAFFNRPPKEVAENLRLVDIALASDPTRRIRVTLADAYDNDVGSYYNALEPMTPGTLWNPATRRINQSLIVLKGRSCVRLLSANYYDPSTNTYKPTVTIGELPYGREKEGEIKEGDIAAFFGLGKRAESTLEFHPDDPNTLFITPKSL